MSFKVLYHEDELADLEEIFERSLEEHPGTTEEFADELFDHIGLLQTFTYLGAPLKEFPEIRQLLHSPLSIYYHLDEYRGAIEILHFWHTSRPPPKF